MAPPLPKCQTTALLTRICKSDHAPSAKALPQPKSSGEQNAPQPKASADQCVPKRQKATFQVANRFMEASVFMQSPWPILSDDKYSMVEEAWRPTIHAEDSQQAIAGSPVGTPWVC